MLLSLHVRNMALIDEEEVTFGEGLNILTGETGAGKSIIIGSIAVALGAKADHELIRQGAEYALVELTFTADTPVQKEKLKSLDLPEEEDGLILIKRKIMPGRTTASVNGESVTARQLRELADVLLDIYGQRENQKLLQKNQQMAVLDEYAGEAAERILSELAPVCRKLRALRKEWEQRDLDESARAREADLLSYELEEIEGAALKEGEDEELENRFRLLSNYRKIEEAVNTAIGLMDGDSYDGRESASVQIGRALREIASVSSLDTSLENLREQLQDLDALAADVIRAAGDYAREMSFDEEEYAAVQERLDLINHLKDKYGRTIGAVLLAAEEKRARLDELSDYENYRNRMREDMKKLDDQRRALCADLTAVRTKAARSFSSEIEKALLDLNFEQVVFETRVQPAADEGDTVSEKGSDVVRMYISMNPGEPPRPLDEIASGGELSRIMLALKTVFAGKEDRSTFIFDEIDSGISGRTAWKVAEKMGRLARDHQIICITHLPQIAAMEDVHFLIEKSVSSGSGETAHTATHIRRLSKEESIDELARMTGGAELTQSTRQNAEEMKRQAAESKQREKNPV